MLVKDAELSFDPQNLVHSHDRGPYPRNPANRCPFGSTTQLVAVLVVASNGCIPQFVVGG